MSSDMTVAEAENILGLYIDGETISPARLSAANDMSDLMFRVIEQRQRYLVAHPDQSDDFKPLDECTEDELLAELNSTTKIKKKKSREIRTVRLADESNASRQAMELFFQAEAARYEQQRMRKALREEKEL